MTQDKEPQEKYGTSPLMVNTIDAVHIVNENHRLQLANETLLSENKRLKGIIASAAWCLLAEENGAIVDTIWMPQGYGGLCGMTLYDNLTGELPDIEFTAIPEEDAQSLQNYAYQALTRADAKHDVGPAKEGKL